MNSPQPNFWIVKGNRNFPNDSDERVGNIREMFECFIGRDETSYWLSKKPLPAGIKKNDRVFFWSSGRDRFVIGVGTLEAVRPPRPKEFGFDVRPISLLDQPVDIGTLRSEYRRQLAYTDEQLPTFLKPAVVATVYPLKKSEANIIIALTLRSPENKRNATLSRTLAEW